MKTKLHERAQTHGSDTRVAILVVLGKLEQPTTVSVVAGIVGIRPSVCSKHLELLEQSGFVIKHKSGKYRLVELDEEGLRSFISELGQLSNPERNNSIWR